MLCRICQAQCTEVFHAQLMNKHKVRYYHCDTCDFLQTEEPYWLAEAYQDSMNLSDTGILFRNQLLARAVTVIIYYIFNREGKFLDYAGGYGVFTRLLRDIGFNYYWHDPYTKNILARGFDGNINESYTLVTSFESFEHFINPLAEIDKMLSLSKNILFSTELLPQPIPQPDQWWYYGLEHGQHIAFYTKKTLQWIANKYQLQVYSFGNIHLLTNKKIGYWKYKWLLIGTRYGLFQWVKRQLRSKTFSDMNDLITSAKS